MERKVSDVYLEEEGQCPCCGSDRTDSIRCHDTPDGLRRMVEYQCLDCGAEFIDVFALVIPLIGKIAQDRLHQTEAQYLAGPAAEDALELLTVAKRLVFDLKESHEDEILHDHHGDDLQKCPCSYCTDIAAAARVIDGICGVEEDAPATGNEKEKGGDGN